MKSPLATCSYRLFAFAEVEPYTVSTLTPQMLKQYEQIVFIDADAFVLENVDELFALGTASRLATKSEGLVGFDSSLTYLDPAAAHGGKNESFAAVNDYFASAFFVLTPSQAVLDSMLTKLGTEVRFVCCEMSNLIIWLARPNRCPFVFHASTCSVARTSSWSRTS